MLRTARTLRGYRPGQLAARVGARARRLIPVAPGRDRPAPPLDVARIDRLRELVARELGDPDAAAALAEGEVSLHGRTEPLPAGRGWTTPPDGRTALWGFTLQYHAHLAAGMCGSPAARAAAEGQLDDWLRSCPPSAAALGLAWHPYVISSRVFSWAVVLGSLEEGPLRAALGGSLWRQLDVLAGHLERDVAGNHLLRNAAALAVGGAMFAGPEAGGLLQAGISLLRSVAADQFGPDGGHVERSPGYHAVGTLDALWALAAAEAAGGTEAGLRGTLALALGWLQEVSPPGTARPHLNDSSPDQGAATEDVLRVGTELGIESASRAQRGLPRYRVLRGPGPLRAVVDAAPPCRGDLPYHSHADSLSLHLAYEGVPMVVDRGVADYEGPNRAWWRSTAAHSTVEIDGTDSSEMVGAFRAGRLAETRVVEEDDTSITARHDGGGRPRLAHERRVALTGPRSLSVHDRTPGARGSVCRLHLPPGAGVRVSDETVVASVSGRTLRIGAPAQRAVVTETRHATGYGRTVSAPTVVLQRDTPAAIAHLSVDD